MPALAWPLATAPALTLLDIGGGAARGKDCLTESIAEGHRGNGEGRGERIFFVYNDIAVGFHQQKKQTGCCELEKYAATAPTARIPSAASVIDSVIVARWVKCR
jgi:hypothetical protein